MDRKKKVFNIISLVLNVLIIAFTAYSVSTFFNGGSGSGNMQAVGTQCFVYFTVDSNILMAILSAVMLVFNIKRLKNIDSPVPKAVSTAKFMSAAAVTLTMITACGFLSLVYSFEMMISGSCLYMHLLTPIIAILSTTVFEAEDRISFPASLTGLIPTIVYGAVYIVMVLVLGEQNGGWKDFYSFNSGMLENKWYIAIVMMLGGTFLITLALRAIHNAVAKRK